MNEKERELRQKMQAKTLEIKSLMDTDKLDDAESATTELRNMKRALDILTEIEDVPGVVPPEARHGEPEEKADANTALAKAIRRRQLTDEERKLFAPIESRTGMVEGTDADGGYIVPRDIQTRINELKRELNPLESLVNVEPVTTMSGTRIFEKWATMTAFAKVAEMGAIGETTNPQFTAVTYAIEKYAGILPMSKDLLADTDQNLLDYVLRWLAKKDVITRNAEIITIMKTLTAKPIATLDDIKGVLNVDLDPAISILASVVTNQDGFNFLDKQKDSEGHYLLQPNPLNPTQKLLFSHPVSVSSNNYLPSDKTSGTKAPLVIGSLKDSITLFDRQALSLEGTSIGGNSFIRDSYDIKGIDRFDTAKTDDGAAIYGTLTIA